jgi:hypothetical protein
MNGVTIGGRDPALRVEQGTVDVDGEQPDQCLLDPLEERFVSVQQGLPVEV